MIPEEHMKVIIVVLKHEGNVLPTLPSVDVRGAKGRALAEPLTDAVHTQELLYFDAELKGGRVFFTRFHI